MAASQSSNYNFLRAFQEEKHGRNSLFAQFELLNDPPPPPFSPPVPFERPSAFASLTLGLRALIVPEPHILGKA